MSYIAFKNQALTVLDGEPTAHDVYRSGAGWFLVLTGPDGFQMGFPAIHSLMEGPEDVKAFVDQALAQFKEELTAHELAVEINANMSKTLDGKLL
jgi:hypothetical protein